MTHLSWLAAAPALTACGSIGWRYGYVGWNAYVRDWTVAERPGRAALTFDDGPDPEGTPAVLDDLAAADVRATFFVLGERVVRHPDVVAAIAAAGHELALHGWSHRNAVWQSSFGLRDGLRRSLAALAGVVERRPRFYRPPYGVLSPAAARLAEQADLEPYLWTAWARDWCVLPPDEIQADLRAGLTPGAVLLLHDGEGTGGQPGAVANMRRALLPFLREARAAGYRLEPLGSLIDG
jgi:peptidoglycan/xylan/chitin deacetylase (PgdA/CDA1 family)